MKYLKKIVLLISLLFICGCSNNANVVVEDYLRLYNVLDSKVSNEYKEIVANENLNEENKTLYEEVFKKQYKDMTYEITSEVYSGDEATIEVKIGVYDFYKIQNQTKIYLANNKEDFYDESGNYDVQKYYKYKLNSMLNVTDRIYYTIDFYVVKNGDKWVISSLSPSDLEKIHGIYNYKE